VGQNQLSESAGRDPDETSSLPNGAGRSDESAPEPRLGISHVMVWIACCAVYMGAARFTWADAMRQNNGGFLPVSIALHSLSSGAFLAGVFLFIVRRCRGLSFPIQPGEWLLTVLGLKIGVSLASGVLVHLVTDLPFAGQNYARMATCWLFVIPVVFAGAPRRWRAFFWAVLITDIVLELQISLALIGTFQSSVFRGAIGLLPAAVLLVAVWLDLRRDPRRPWTHWSGVLAYLWRSALYAISIADFILEHNFGIRIFGI
jgi:hypothetical protein